SLLPVGVRGAVAVIVGKGRSWRPVALADAGVVPYRWGCSMSRASRWSVVLLAATSCQSSPQQTPSEPPRAALSAPTPPKATSPSPATSSNDVKVGPRKDAAPRASSESPARGADQERIKQLEALARSGGGARGSSPSHEGE